MPSLAAIASRRAIARRSIVESVRVLADKYGVEVPDNIHGERKTREPHVQRLHQEEAIAQFLTQLVEASNAKAPPAV